MPSFNQWVGIGHVLRDPALKYLPNQTAVADFGIACNRKYKTAGGEEREDVLFLDLSAFGKQAEIISQYVHKGDPLFVTARLRTDSWEDKQTGQKRSKITGVIENFQFIKPRDGGADGDDADQRPRQQSRPAPSQRPQRETSPPFGDEQHFNPDDVPFHHGGRNTQPL